MILNFFYSTRSCIARTQSLLDKIGFNKLECDDLKQKLDERKAEIEKVHFLSSYFNSFKIFMLSIH
jgi:hypothetical protein